MVEPVRLYPLGHIARRNEAEWRRASAELWIEMGEAWEDEIWAEYEAQRRFVVLGWPSDRLEAIEGF